MLDVALKASLDDRTIDEHLATLERLSAVAPDGHIGIECPGQSERGYPPFAVDLVESQVVVTRSTHPAIERGDVILSVSGTAARQLVGMEEEYVSGSPQWRLVGALRRFAVGSLTTGVALRLRRGGNEHDITVPRVRRRVVENSLYSAIEHFDDGVFYVDLSRASMAEIDAVISRLAAAPGVVFDLRGYPRSNNHQVLSYILTQPDNPKAWESIPLIIRPDTGSAPAAWEDTSAWNMPRLSIRQPHIDGRVAFVTGPRAISYAESVMALVEHYHLGEIIGSTTAGTNGDIAQITLPTGCTTSFTGRRVAKLGGGRHHLVGVQPTIPVSRSIAGVQAGRDEVLEKAFAYVRSRVK